MTGLAKPAPAAARTAAPARPGAGRRVTDAPTRMAHWLLALSFAGAWVTAESERWRLLHAALGYGFGALLIWRLGYGVLGPRQTGLALLWRRVAGTGTWLRGLAQARSARALADALTGRPAQNLAMGWLIAAMWALVLPLVLSGHGGYVGWGEAQGLDEVLAELHEGLANTFGAVVLAHLSALVLLSALRRQNQALPMLTGRLPGPGPDLARHNRGWLALLLLAAVLAVVVWCALPPDGGEPPAQARAAPAAVAWASASGSTSG